MSVNSELQFNSIILNGERDGKVIHDLLCPTYEQLKKRDELLANLPGVMDLNDDLTFTISNLDIISPRDIVSKDLSFKVNFIISSESNHWFLSTESEQALQKRVEICNNTFSEYEKDVINVIAA